MINSLQSFIYQNSARRNSVWWRIELEIIPSWRQCWEAIGEIGASQRKMGQMMRYSLRWILSCSFFMKHVVIWWLCVRMTVVIWFVQNNFVMDCSWLISSELVWGWLICGLYDDDYMFWICLRLLEMVGIYL